MTLAVTRLGLSVLFGLALAGCPLRVPEQQAPPRPPRPLQLLAHAPERETSQLADQRVDVEIDTLDWDRTPRVVASGETAYLRLDGARARLFGDADGKLGWSVDNVLLLEIVGQRGDILDRAVIGSSDPVLVGRDPVDNVGQRSFTFEPGEVDITAKLPGREPFKIRATVLDYFGVGRVSDVFLILDEDAQRSGSDDDLRGQ
jgi:hypothetical protein